MATTTTNTTNPDPTSPSPSNKPSKPRPITSCSACRIRKVKCNRRSPCSACIARSTESDCTYATTDEDRQAIAQAELISELRATRNRLHNQLPGNPSNSKSTLDRRDGEGNGDGDDVDALEAVYAVLRRGSWDLVQEVVGRIRGGKDLREIVGHDQSNTM